MLAQVMAISVDSIIKITFQHTTIKKNVRKSRKKLSTRKTFTSNIISNGIVHEIASKASKCTIFKKYYRKNDLSKVNSKSILKNYTNL